MKYSFSKVVGLNLQCYDKNAVHSGSFFVKFLDIFRGCSYGGELARLGGLARLGEITFSSRSYGIFYLSPIKKFVMLLEKHCSFYNKSEVKPSCRAYVPILFN